jgi:hypothetical protein
MGSGYWRRVRRHAVKATRADPRILPLMLWMVLLAFLIGPLATGLGKLGNGGDPAVAALGILLVPVGWVVQVVGRQVEALAFGIKQGPLILPYNTGAVFTAAFSSLMAGGSAC